MNRPISTLELEGRRYAVVPVEVLEKYALQLLESYTPDEVTPPYVPNKGTPWEIVRRTIAEDVSKARAWREYLGLSQEEVAARMGVTQEHARAGDESFGRHPGAAEGLIAGSTKPYASGSAVAISSMTLRTSAASSSSCKALA